MASVKGRVSLNIYEGKNGGYSVAIDDIAFHVSSSVFLAFKNNDPYRIYYAPSSKVILSAEALRDE